MTNHSIEDIFFFVVPQQISAEEWFKQSEDIARAKKLLTSLLEEKGLDITPIVLFGSATRHENRESSDLDLIVVSKDFSGQDIFSRVERTRGIHRKMVKTLRRPIDLMFFFRRRVAEQLCIDYRDRPNRGPDTLKNNPFLD